MSFTQNTKGWMRHGTVLKTSLGSDEQEKGWKERGRNEGREGISSEKERDLIS